MFFKKNKEAKKIEVAEIIKKMEIQKNEIKRKLQEMSDVNQQLDHAVKETQKISLSVIEKLNKELKIAKKSITSVCSKLKEGIILVDHTGKIIQLNPSGEKLFNIENKSIEGLPFNQVVESLDPTVDATGEKILMRKNFFIRLSNKLITKLKRWDQVENRYVFCKDCLKADLPCWFDMENEIFINAITPDKSQNPLRVAFSFSILDNDPETVNDLIYIFIFRKAPPVGIARRYYEQTAYVPSVTNEVV